MWWPYDLLQENRKRYQSYLNEVSEGSSGLQSSSDVAVLPVRREKMQDSESELHDATSDESLSGKMPKPSDNVLQVCDILPVSKARIENVNSINFLRTAHFEHRFGRKIHTDHHPQTTL